MSWTDLPEHNGNLLRECLRLDELYDLIEARVRRMRTLHENVKDPRSEGFGIAALDLVDAINAVASCGISELNERADRILEFKGTMKYELELGLQKVSNAIQ